MDRDKSSAGFHQAECDIPVPINQFSTVMLGPGVTVTAAAMKLFAENNCLLRISHARGGEPDRVNATMFVVTYSPRTWG